MASLMSAVNNVGYGTSLQDSLDELSNSNDIKDKIIVDLLKALSESHPELIVKYMDFIARVEDESKK
jgi:hypothetical protein